MAFKVKMVILAALLLLGFTGVAFASGQLPGVSGGAASLVGFGFQGTDSGSTWSAGPAVSGEYGGNTSGDQYGDDQELNADDNAAADEYGDDDDATGVENDDADEPGDTDEHHTGNMGRGAEHANEHANVPETTPVSGGNAPQHEGNDNHSQGQGGSSEVSGHNSASHGERESD